MSTAVMCCALPTASSSACPTAPTGRGPEALTALLGDLGHRAQIAQTPPGVLHFKTGCGLIDDRTVLAVPAMRDCPEFAGLEVVLTPMGEEGAGEYPARPRPGADRRTGLQHAACCYRRAASRSARCAPIRSRGSTPGSAACRCAGIRPALWRIAARPLPGPSMRKLPAPSSSSRCSRRAEPRRRVGADDRPPVAFDVPEAKLGGPAAASLSVALDGAGLRFIGKTSGKASLLAFGTTPTRPKALARRRGNGRRPQRQ